MANMILRSLPSEEHADIVGHTVPVRLSQNDLIHEAGQTIEHVYFLESGMVSLLTGRNGRSITTGVVGREGLVGSKVILGLSEGHGQAVVHLGGQALRMPAMQFLGAYKRLPTFARLVNSHIGLLLFQAEQNALCHALHSIES